MAANEVRVPVLGRTTVLTRQVSLAQVNRTAGGGWEQRHEACSIAAESDSALTTTSFPPGFLRAIQPKRYLVELYERDGGYRLRADTGTLAIGFRPDQAGGVLPTSADHPAVFDWDEDGHPGGSITVSAPLFGEVEVFVVQVSRGAFDGAITATDGVATAMDGDFRLEGYAQATIGASNRLFHTTPKTTFVPSRSEVHMRRVGAGTTCADLLSGR